MLAGATEVTATCAASTLSCAARPVTKRPCAAASKVSTEPATVAVTCNRACNRSPGCSGGGGEGGAEGGMGGGAPSVVKRNRSTYGALSSHEEEQFSAGTGLMRSCLMRSPLSTTERETAGVVEVELL